MAQIQRCRARLKHGSNDETGIRCHLPKGHGTRANNDGRKVFGVVDPLTGISKPLTAEQKRTHQARALDGRKPAKDREFVYTRWDSK